VKVIGGMAMVALSPND